MKTQTTALRITRILLVSFVFDTICLQTVRSENWPAWRGVSGLGISDEKELPTSWSPTNNVRWRVPLPEPGNSTPIVWNDRIFVTQARARQNRRQLMCFARQDGRLLWNEGLTYTEQETTHGSNYYCSTSPVTDGEHVITWFGSAGVHCYDVHGKHLWSRNLGKRSTNSTISSTSFHLTASSPLVKSKQSSSSSVRRRIGLSRPRPNH